jgi:nicotinamidase-related amidase
MPGNTALLVIDVQRAATGKEGKVTLGYERCVECISRINLLIDHANREGWDICCVAHVTPWYHLLPAAVTHFAFMRGSEGAALDERLDVVADERYTKIFGSALERTIEEVPLKRRGEPPGAVRAGIRRLRGGYRQNSVGEEL